ncbi:hypothetical protein SAY87_012704 [Trapa incisa]|uniref:Brix domain-containing protein n=1 Tax=Trapa incisa TaxID=236973 RepID=A0AAN7JJM1_9MYRT|nr:hypothetical protein SAY87_012704 [Trapa incisa]
MGFRAKCCFVQARPIIGFKRKKDNEDLESELDDGIQKKVKKTVEEEKGIFPSMIKNKEKRSEVHGKKIKARDPPEKGPSSSLKRWEPVFTSELCDVIPNSCYYNRGDYDLNKIVEYARNKDFTSLIVVHTNRREPDALLIIGLPDGPTAHFRLSKLVLLKDIKNHGNPTNHHPELILNNLPHDWVIGVEGVWPTIYIEVDHLQHGTFDTKSGQYEWVHKIFVPYIMLDGNPLADYIDLAEFCSLAFAQSLDAFSDQLLYPPRWYGRLVQCTTPATGPISAACSPQEEKLTWANTVEG